MDAAGNDLVAPYTAGEAYELDNTAPPAPSGLYVLDDTGVGDDGVTADNTLEICGGADPGASVAMYGGGVLLGSTTADGSGEFCFDHTATTLGDGLYAFSATAADAVGNVSEASADLVVVVVVVSSMAPSVASLTRADASPTRLATAG